MPTAKSVGAPEQVWIGVTVGIWPVQAFINEEQAMKWSAESDLDAMRYIIGPIRIAGSTVVRRAEVVPETYGWVTSPAEEETS